MGLRDVQRTWTRFATEDPLWAILTDPGKKNNRWNPEEFFRTGEQEIDGVFAYLERLGVEPRLRRALDFGCGVGRLTQPLCVRFEQVYGVDISPPMIELANQFNRYPDRCRYLLNESANLRGIGLAQVDFVYSNITLQHMPPRYAKRYLREFLRILAPGGVLVFQLPSEMDPGSGHILTRGLRKLWRRVYLGFIVPFWQQSRPLMEMHGIGRDAIVRLITSAGAEVIDITPDLSAGEDWRGYRYCVRRGPRSK